MLCEHQPRSRALQRLAKQSHNAKTTQTVAMFSWSNNTSTSTSRAKSTYPGRRLQQNRAAAAAATPIQGSIRPPSSSSHTRAQHLTSYIEDPALQRSTRRVSSGTNSTQEVIRSTNYQNLIISCSRCLFCLALFLTMSLSSCLLFVS